MKLSIIILTHNSATFIKDCIKSSLFADEIILIDDYSTDNTLDIVADIEHSSITIIKRHLNGDFSSQRNAGLQKAQGEWVLFIDSDEIISDQLRQEIQLVINNSEYEGYLIRRVDYFLGQKMGHGELGNIYLLRLAKRNGSWQGKVHETWSISGKVGYLHNFLTHYSHNNLFTFINKIDMYTTLRAEELYRKKKRSNRASIIIYPVSKFIKGYIIQEGYKDGLAGFVFAVFMSFHSFLVRSKLYLLTHKNS